MALKLPAYFSIIILMLTGLNASAQTGGYAGYKFLTLAPSARITALGGNLISIYDDDLNNAYQNPSLLNPKMDNQFALNVANYFSDIQYGYVATAQHFKNVGTFSIGIQYIDYGTFEHTNDRGDVLGEFTAGENAVHIGYGRAYNNFAYGAALKTVFSHFESYNARAVMADLSGTYIDTVNGFTAAFVLKNIGTQTRTFYGERESLPFEAQFGLSKKLKHAPFRFSLTLHNLQRFDLTYQDPNGQSQQIDLATGEPIKEDYTIADKLARHVIIGTELILSPNFNVRVGYNHQRRKELTIPARNATVGFSWGLGIKIKKISFAYGSARYHLAGSTNMFSLSVNPNDFIRRKI